jgi:hypothetical protein
MSDASFTQDRPTNSPIAEGQPLASLRPATASPWLERLAARWQTLEASLTRLSDWFNPILIKETRQALRSWPFALSFLLLLVACWVVTIGGVAVIGPSIYYAAGGGELLRAYYFILSLPLLIVVPFAAFRSLAAEREDNTYDLVSITTLRPRQIIGGKLASAVVQMIMFFSAITPCLAFTYLLRGVDTPTIALLLVYTFLASLALSMLGLLLATLPRQRYGQLLLSIGFVAVLIGVSYEAHEIAARLVRSGFEYYSDPNFWVAHIFGVALFVTTMVLAYLAAAAMITFPMENRSTPLRVAMLFQQAAIVAAAAWYWIIEGYQPEEVMLLAAVGGCYWFVMGMMLDGEQPQMSRRVMRSLPQSILGRALFTWLQPGPSSGYMFAVANLTTLLIITLIPTVHLAWTTGAGLVWPNNNRFMYVVILGWSYIVAYLGFGTLVVALLRRVSDVTMFASVLLHLLLLLAGSGIPTSIHRMSAELQSEPYSYIEVTNPIWTCQYILQFSPTPEENVLLVVVPAAALCALLLNLPGLVREITRVRTALPTRIAEDEAELHPPPELLPQNPWEADEQSA